ncbi:MAG: diaminopimelate epimerase [Bacteroidota bacterium]
MANREHKLAFTKMQGAGNDFVVWDNRDLSWSLDTIISITPTLCDRHFGVGADGVLVLAESEIENADYQMIYRNPDGSDAGMCGNGGRCLARYAHDLGYDANHTFHVHDSIYRARINGQKVELSFPGKVEVRSISDQHGLSAYQVDPGTEHIVLFVNHDLLSNHDRLLQIARDLRYNHELAPKGCNVNFVHFSDDQRWMLKTYERGVEHFTLACGTGAIASALASYVHFQDGESSNEVSPTSTHRIRLHPEGAPLTVDFEQIESSNSFTNLRLIGPAEYVYEGQIQFNSISA